MRRLFASIILIIMLLSLTCSMVGCGDQDQTQEPVVTTSLLRIGILSDIHSNTGSAFQPLERVEKALRFFKEKGVDGVMITGDLLDTGNTSSLLELQEVWLDVFPNNTNDLTGERVEPLFVYGNHDEVLINEEFWFDGIGSEYEDAWIKEIKGYQFVGVHYSKEDGTEVEKLLEQAKNKSADKPFFFAQHVAAAGTVMGGYQNWGGNKIPVQEALKKSYNCVVFTGHSHIPITDERAIWQSNSKRDPQCTVVSCGTMYYGFLQDFSTLDINGNKYDTQQGMYMTVDGSQVTLERYSFTDMELGYDADGKGIIDSSKVKQIGTPWTFDAMQQKNRPYDYEDRAEEAMQPVFPDDAVLEVTELTAKSAVLTVPAASVGAPEGFSDMVQSYYAEVTDVATGEILLTVEIAAPYHVDREPERMGQPVSMKLTQLEPETEYTVNVYARECYQKESAPLTIQITTPEEDA